MSTILNPVPPANVEDPYRFGYRLVTETDANGKTIIRQIPLTEEQALHPGEEDFYVNSNHHDLILSYLKAILRLRVSERPDVALLSDHRIDWEVPQGWVHAPDISFFESIHGDWNKSKGTLYVVRTGAIVRLLMEVASPSTRDNDFGPKLKEYFRVSVPTYIIVDLPDEGDDGPIALYGYRAGAHEFELMQPDERGRLWLAAVELWLGVDGHEVYFEDAAGNRLRDHGEALRELDAAQQQIREMEAELTRLRNLTKES